VTKLPGYWKGRPASETCPWCLQRVTPSKMALLCLHGDSGIRRQLLRAGRVEWLEEDFHFSHGSLECNPRNEWGEYEDELGYHVPFRRIRERGTEGVHGDTLHGWFLHVSEKGWFTESMRHGATKAWAIQQTSTRGRRGRTPLSPRLRTSVLERDGFRCRRCGHTADAVRLEVDHVMPVARGGKNCASNLQTLCASCNLGKSDAAPTAWDARGLAAP
jgi:5-methylcytosine-specific restriction endonuclease McrA